MPSEPEQQSAVDTGLAALIMLLRFQGIGADAEQIRHRFGGASIGVPEILRCAKDMDLKARAFRTSWARLADTPLPGIAALKDGTFLLIGKVADDKIIVQSPLSPRPQVMAQAEFEAAWDGRVILI